MKASNKPGFVLLTLVAILLIFTGVVAARDSDLFNESSAGAQDSVPPADVALAYLQQNRESLGLSAADLADIQVTDTTVSRLTGVTSVYFVQRLNGVEVFNGLINVSVNPDGTVLTVGNRFVSNLSEAVKDSSASLTAQQAVEAAASHLGLTISTPLQTIEPAAGSDQETLFSDGGISQNSIPAKLVYDASGKVPTLAWNVIIYQLDGQHWWNVRVDANTGGILSQNDWVVHDDFGSHSGGQDGLAAAPEVRTQAGQAVPLGPTPVADGSSYRVYHLPVESPNHSSPPAPADGRTLENQPADAGGGSPFGWHDTNGAAGAEFTTTQGNNVHAYTDTNDDNNPDPGSSPDGGGGLDFDFPLDLTQPPSAYRPAAVTNLFHWNNLIHDINYRYGFDEEHRNFQENNYGNPGLGSDYVFAEAQDGGGTNNANFATPPDGQNPRMQMYIWTTVIPNRDGDLDNGIIAHEYGHGISNRMVGDGSTNCLFNNEQMGEGWSDWQSIIMTMENGDQGTDPRGVGTYALNQPTNGPGIRPAPYTTDMGVNPYTYGDIGSLAIPHGVGFVWATMLWEMNWGLIDEHGFDEDLYMPNTPISTWSGNQVAHALVTEGFNHTVCSPGFVDGRDGILAADQALTGGENACIIWTAFAKRGLGFSADQGSSNSTGDETEAFDVPGFCLTLSVTPESQNICVGDTADYDVTLGVAFTPPVIMSATGHPAGTTATFVPNPVPAVPGNTALTIGNTSGATAGNYTVTILGVGGVTDTIDVTLGVYSTVPGSAPTLISPVDGATNISLSPTLDWTAVANTSDYYVEIATDAGFSTIVYTATASVDTHDVAVALEPLTTYYWRVTSQNPCGDGSTSTVFDFTTRDIPPILLVDDDGDAPDVRAYYTDALDDIGALYDVWDTAGTDNEPTALELAPYDAVIWFTGVLFGGTAGPGGTSEAALGSWLDEGGNCLFISSQDYLYDRGFTPFMDTYLGASSGTSDVAQATVTGAGSVFTGLGPYTLAYPFTNYSDIINPDGPPAELAFAGDVDNAAVNKDTGVYHTTWWGFPFEAIPTDTDRAEAMQTVVLWCGALGPVGTLEGTVTDADTSLGIEGATVTAVGPSTITGITDANGDYSITLPIGTYDVTAAMENYVPVTVNGIVIITDTTTTQDFVLQGSSLTYSPPFIEESMEIGDIVTNTVTVTNTGPLTIEYSVRIGNFGGPGLSIINHSTRPIEPSEFTGRAASSGVAALLDSPVKLEPALNPPGDVLFSAPFSGGSPLGITMSPDGDIWVADLFSGQTEQFDPDLNFITSFPHPTGFATTSGVTYDTQNGTLWWINADTFTMVEGDTSGTPTGNTISLPAVGLPAGVSYDPDTDLFYFIDIVSDDIYAVDRSGTVAAGYPVPQTDYDTGAGLFGNGLDAVGGLFDVLVGLISDGQVTRAVATDQVGVNLGLETPLTAVPDSFINDIVHSRLVPNEIIYVVGNATSTIYAVEPEDLGIVVGGGGGWAYPVPDEGSIPPNSVSTFDVVFDARSLYQVGDYTAELTLDGTFVNVVPSMPLTMHLSCSTCGFLDGSVFDDATGDPLSADFHVIGPNGFDVTFSGETYAIGVQPGDYTFEVSADGYVSQTETINATAGVTTTTDFSLRPDVPEISLNPLSIEVDVVTGTSITEILTIENSGAGASTFRIREGDSTPLVPGALFNQGSHIFDSFDNTAVVIGPASVRSVEGRTALDVLVTPEVWSDGTSLPPGDGVVRYAHAQCEDDPDSFYVISGVNQSLSVTDNVWRYDADTDSWTPLASFPTALEGPSATCYEGYIYVVGGGDPGGGTNQFYIYDIANDSWLTGASLPRGVWGAAVGAWDGTLVMLGGAADFSGSSASAEVNIYDIATDTWTGNGTSMLEATSTAGYVQAGEYVYVVGGWGTAAPGSNVNLTQRYDISSDTWESGPAFTLASSDFALALSSENLYAIGGDANGGGFFDASTAVDVLDHTAWPAGSWASLGDPLSSPRTANNGGFCTDDGSAKVWSVAGIDSSFIVSGVPNYLDIAEGCFSGAVDVPWLSEDPEMGSVAGDSSSEVNITFTALPTLTVGSSYTATLIVTTQDPVNNRVEVQVQMNVVELVYGVSVSSDMALSGAPGEMVMYSVTVTNTGNTEDTFDLTVAGHSWTTTLSENSITLDAGASGTVMVHVTIPASAADGDDDTTTVTATSVNDAAATASADLTTTAVIPPPTTFTIFMPVLRKP